MKTTLIKAALLADGIADRALTGQAILVVGDRIELVGSSAEVEKEMTADCQVIDLGE